MNINLGTVSHGAWEGKDRELQQQQLFICTEVRNTAGVLVQNNFSVSNTRKEAMWGHSNP